MRVSAIFHCGARGSSKVYAKVITCFGNRENDGVRFPFLIVGSNPTVHPFTMYANGLVLVAKGDKKLPSGTY